MGIDGMRVGGGRCPPLIVAGLMVACFLLVCNWWSLSAENTELLRQIDGLSQQLKISAEQRDEFAGLHSKSELRYKTAEDEISKLHRQLGLERDAAKKKDDTITVCEIELDSLKKLDVTKTVTVQTLRLEKETINTQLEEKKEDNKRLQEELENLQDELSKLKLSHDLENKKSSVAESPVLPKAEKPSAPQLGPVPEGAVEVSPSGRRGLKYYGIPVLPQNPPGAVRQPPRFSVTMLKAMAKETPLTNETQNGGNQDSQNVADAPVQSEEVEGEIIDNDNVDGEDTAQESIRDRMLQKQVTDPDVKPSDQ